MDIISIIGKKERREVLTKEELKYAVNGFLDGTITDYQMSALLTEIDILGLSEKETIDLTDIMLKSGEILNFDIKPVADKHSTGGVGDKTTLVLAPLVASLGVNIAKMSGRGLGHTGGTIDKLESIKGFKTEMSLEDFKEQIKKIHIGLIGQMDTLVPADKKIYSLRDVSGSVDSVPLIASSIMSKKLASGADTIVIDLKVGKGALVDSEKEAQDLGKLMVKIGKMNNRKIACVLTNMDEPLGYAVGNALEVKESIDTLKGNGPKDLTNLVIRLSSLIVSMSKNISIKEAEALSKENLKNGKAYNKLKQWVKAQGGDIKNIKVAKNVLEVASNKDGFIKKVDALKVGTLAHALGAGRLTKDEKIDLEVGIVLTKKVADKVKKGETIAKIYYNKKLIDPAELLNAFTITDKKIDKPKLIMGTIK